MYVAWNLYIAIDLGSREKFMGGIFILYIICFHVIYDSKLHSALQLFFLFSLNNLKAPSGLSCQTIELPSVYGKYV